MFNVIASAWLTARYLLGTCFMLLLFSPWTRYLTYLWKDFDEAFQCGGGRCWTPEKL